MKTMRILICILLFSSSQLFAQDKDLKEIYTDVTRAINSALLTKSGSMELSGSASFNYYNTRYSTDEKLTQQTLQLEPVFLYFIFDNVSLGLDLTYFNQKTDDETSEGSKHIEQTFAGPIAKMYFTDDRLRPFILADYLFLVGDNYKGRELELGAGLFYHVAGNFGFSLFGKYGIIWSGKDDIDNQKRVFIGAGITNFIL